MKHACPLCQGTDLADFLRRDNVPVHQNLIARSEKEAFATPRGTLDMAACRSCGFVFNRAFDLALLDYGDDYDNCQTCSPAFDAYTDGLVRKLVEEDGVRGATIVEVGCGQGHFLRKLVDYPGADNRGFGFDPSYRGPASILGGRMQVRRTYYDESCTDIAADIVVCRHVIEHVPDPLPLLLSVARALGATPGARVFFETPCVDWILTNKVVWDFFYEHCSLFTDATLAFAFERAGFSVKRVTHVFGGQYLWLEARAGRDCAVAPPDGRGTAARAQAYGAAEGALRAAWAVRLQALKRRGPVAVWGAGAKGATFANIADPGRSLIDCLIDLNPAKQGAFVPGTGHPILAPEAAAARGTHVAVLMNPNYRAENERLLTDKTIEMDLVEWSDT